MPQAFDARGQPCACDALVATQPPPGVSLGGDGWEIKRLEHEVQAALAAAAAAQRTATAAEDMAAEQQAYFTLQLQRERLRLQVQHQAEVSKLWEEWADVQESTGTAGLGDGSGAQHGTEPTVQAQRDETSIVKSNPSASGIWGGSSGTRT